MSLFRFKGKVYPKEKGEKFHFVEIPELDIATQSKTIKEGVEMALDAIHTLFLGENFNIEFDGYDSIDKGIFYLISHNPGPLLGRMLKNLRIESGLTISQVSKELGSDSPNFYGQYEQGKSVPSVGKLEEILNVLTRGKRGVCVSFPVIKRKKAS